MQRAENDIVIEWRISVPAALITKMLTHFKLMDEVIRMAANYAVQSMNRPLRGSPSARAAPSAGDDDLVDATAASSPGLANHDEFEISFAGEAGD